METGIPLVLAVILTALVNSFSLALDEYQSTVLCGASAVLFIAVSIPVNRRTSSLSVACHGVIEKLKGQPVDLICSSAMLILVLPTLLLTLRKSTWPFIWYLVFIGPLLEELFFRLSLIWDRRRPSYLATSILLFTASHFHQYVTGFASAKDIVLVALGGFLYTMLYYLNGVLSPIVLHSAGNLNYYIVRCSITPNDRFEQLLLKTYSYIAVYMEFYLFLLFVFLIVARKVYIRWRIKHLRPLADLLGSC